MLFLSLLRLGDELLRKVFVKKDHRKRYATEKQKKLMDEKGIDYPYDCTVEEASRLITEYQEDVYWHGGEDDF